MKWSEANGIVLANNCGLDCSHTPFAATNITVEIVNVERSETQEDVDLPQQVAEQLTLFGELA